MEHVLVAVIDRIVVDALALLDDLAECAPRRLQIGDRNDPP